MAYTTEDKLPEDFFQQTLKEKAEMIKKYIKDTGNPLVFCAHIGPNMATFKFYSPTEEDSLKLHYTFSNPGGPKRTTIFFVDSTELCVEGTVNST